MVESSKSPRGKDRVACAASVDTRADEEPTLPDSLVESGRVERRLYAAIPESYGTAFEVGEEEYVATEKVDGAHMAYDSASRDFLSRRKVKAMTDRDFFDYHLLRPDLQPCLDALQTHLGEHYVVYGELYGGYYSNGDAPARRTTRCPVQTRIRYSAEKAFVVFDIFLKLQGRYGDWGEVQRACAQARLRCVPELFRGTFQEIDARDIENLRTQLPRLHQEEDECALTDVVEGIVIRPAKELPGRHRFRLKKKTEHFTERKTPGGQVPRSSRGRAHSTDLRAERKAEDIAEKTDDKSRRDKELTTLPPLCTPSLVAALVVKYCDTAMFLLKGSPAHAAETRACAECFAEFKALWQCSFAYGLTKKERHAVTSFIQRAVREAKEEAEATRDEISASLTPTRVHSARSKVGADVGAVVGELLADVQVDMATDFLRPGTDTFEFFSRMAKEAVQDVVAEEDPQPLA